MASLLLVLIGFHFSYVVISRGGDDYGVDLSHQPPEKNNGSILERNSVNDIVLFSKDDDDVIPADIHPDDAGNKIIGTSIKDGKYQVNQKFLSYLRTLPPFPKKLHIIFPHKDYYRARDPPLPFVKHSVLRFIELNPKWNVTVHDDADVDRLIERAADDGIISVEEKLILVGNETSPGAHREFLIYN